MPQLIFTMSPIQDPALPEGSLVLITGANGFIGSHIVDQLLLAGYRVRGIVRDKQKNSWMGPFFDGKYGKEKFELVEVKDLADVGSLTQTLQGCEFLTMFCAITNSSRCARSHPQYEYSFFVQIPSSIY
jgi:uncharacterized protein YbjT (DUF2867 family)